MSLEILKNNQKKSERGGKRPGSGRKPGVSKATQIKRKIQDYITEEDVRDLIIQAKKLARKGDSQLIRYLLDQVFGKAPQPIEGTDEDGAIHIKLDA